MIIVGVITLVATIIHRLSDFSSPNYQEALKFNDLSRKEIKIPNGTNVVSIDIDEGRVFMHLKSELGDSSLLILDSFTFEKLGSIDFQPTE